MRRSKHGDWTSDFFIEDANDYFSIINNFTQISHGQALWLLVPTLLETITTRKKRDDTITVIEFLEGLLT